MSRSAAAALAVVVAAVAAAAALSSAVEVPTRSVEVPTRSVEVPTGSAEDPTRAVENEAPTTAASVAVATDDAPAPSAARRSASDRPVPTRTATRSTVLVRGVGVLDPSVVARLESARRVDALAQVRSGSVLLRTSRDADGRVNDRLPAGWGIPVDVVAVEPERYAALLPERRRDAFTDLGPGEALLGETSAKLRGLGRGATLRFDGGSFEVSDIVDDRTIGTAELVVSHDGAERIGVTATRYVLVQSPRPPATLDAVVAGALEGVPRVLARSFARGRWPASWREVLPQAVVKERFGEFAIRPGEGRTISQEQGWVERHIATATVPIVGDVRCHRAMLPALSNALSELERRGLAELVDPGDYAGCFSPRLIAPGASVSRHAWGLAVDVNASRNPFGAPSAQDPRLVDVMERHGFGFGGRWPVPDAMHFEYRGAPRNAGRPPR